MKLLNICFFGGLAIIVAAFSAHRAAAQEGRPAPPRTVTSVALLDVVKVFKNHPKFEARMNAIKKDMEALENRFKRERADIMKQRESAAAYKAGSPDRRRIEEAVLRRMAGVRVCCNARWTGSRTRSGCDWAGCPGPIRWCAPTGR